MLPQQFFIDFRHRLERLDHCAHRLLRELLGEGSCPAYLAGVLARPPPSTTGRVNQYRMRGLNPAP